MGAMKELWMDAFEAALERLVADGITDEEAYEHLDKNPKLVDDLLIDRISFIADRGKDDF